MQPAGDNNPQYSTYVREECRQRNTTKYTETRIGQADARTSICQIVLSGGTIHRNVPNVPNYWPGNIIRWERAVTLLDFNLSMIIDRARRPGSYSTEGMYCAVAVAAPCMSRMEPGRPTGRAHHNVHQSGGCRNTADHLRRCIPIGLQHLTLYLQEYASTRSKRYHLEQLRSGCVDRI